MLRPYCRFRLLLLLPVLDSDLEPDPVSVLALVPDPVLRFLPDSECTSISTVCHTRSDLLTFSKIPELSDLLFLSAH